MSAATTPASVEHNETDLVIRWKDGATASYNLERLRRNCPCAECRRIRGENPQQLAVLARDVTILSWSRMGWYGMSITWSDGHATGIYTYDLLRFAHDKGQDYPTSE